MRRRDMYKFFFSFFSIFFLGDEFKAGARLVVLGRVAKRLAAHGEIAAEENRAFKWDGVDDRLVDGMGLVFSRRLICEECCGEKGTFGEADDAVEWPFGGDVGGEVGEGF